MVMSCKIIIKHHTEYLICIDSLDGSCSNAEKMVSLLASSQLLTVIIVILSGPLCWTTSRTLCIWRFYCISGIWRSIFASRFHGCSECRNCKHIKIVLVVCVIFEIWYAAWNHQNVDFASLTGLKWWLLFLFQIIYCEQVVLVFSLKFRYWYVLIFRLHFLNWKKEMDS